MITITKNNQPGSLISFIKNGGKAYSDLDKGTKKDITDSLLQEQGYLCAYCMRRIPRKERNPNCKIESDPEFLSDNVRIEHLKEQTNNKSLQLDYHNMFAVCPGYLGGYTHCDRSKGCNPISLSPLDARLEQSISYNIKDGAIKSSNHEWNTDLTATDRLNLNSNPLKACRKKVIEGVIETITKRKWSKIQLQNQLDLWNQRDKEGNSREYLGIVRYFINRKLRTFK